MLDRIFADNGTRHVLTAVLADDDRAVERQHKTMLIRRSIKCWLMPHMLADG